jgi:putative Ca2+/H+ antiporter (TMEM165/GDT1 family)
VATAIGFAFVGSVLGKRLAGKVTMKAIQLLTGVLLLAVAIALGAGLV